MQPYFDHEEWPSIDLTSKIYKSIQSILQVQNHLWSNHGRYININTSTYVTQTYIIKIHILTTMTKSKAENQLQALFAAQTSNSATLRDLLCSDKIDSSGSLLPWPTWISSCNCKVKAASEDTSVHTCMLKSRTVRTCCQTRAHSLQTDPHNKLLARKHLLCQCWSACTCLSLSHASLPMGSKSLPPDFWLLDTAETAFHQVAFCMEIPRFKPEIHREVENLALAWQLLTPTWALIKVRNLGQG